MRVPAGVADTRPRRPARRPPCLALGWLQEVSCCQTLLQALAGAAPTLMRNRCQDGFIPAGLLCPLPQRQPPLWGRRQSWPLQEGSGCGHLRQPGTRTAAQRGALHLRSRNRKRAAGTCCQQLPARSACSLGAHPACSRLPAGIFPLPVAAARLWPAPPPRLTAAAATSGRFRLWSPRLPVSDGLQLRRHAEVMGPSQWLPQSRLTANRRARAAQ